LLVTRTARLALAVAVLSAMPTRGQVVDGATGPEPDDTPLRVDRATGLALLAPGVTSSAWASLLEMATAAFGPKDVDLIWPDGLDINLSYEANVLRTLLGKARRGSDLPLLGGALVHDKGVTIALGPGSAAMRVHDGAPASFDVPGVTTTYGLGTPSWRARVLDLQLAPGDVIVVYPESAHRSVGLDRLAAAAAGVSTPAAATEGRLQVWREASEKGPRIRRRALVLPRGTVVLVHVD
jgi:hypothetical protein